MDPEYNEVSVDTSSSHAYINPNPVVPPKYIVLGIVILLLGLILIINPLILVLFVIPNLSSLYDTLGIDESLVVPYVVCGLLVIFAIFNIFAGIQLIRGKQSYFKFGIISIVLVAILFVVSVFTYISFVIFPIYSITQKFSVNNREVVPTIPKAPTVLTNIPTKSVTAQQKIIPSPTQIKTNPKPTSTVYANIPTRASNPPIGQISWPGENETIYGNSSSETICIVDSMIGGDVLGVERRFKYNNGSFGSYKTLGDNSTRCFVPSVGANNFSVQFRNKYSEESPTYSRTFYFYVRTPTPVPDTTPPEIFLVDAPGEGTVVNSDQFCFTVSISDNKSSYPFLYMSYKLEGGEWQPFQTVMRHCFVTYNSELQQQIFYVKAKDEAGNVSPEIRRLFYIDSPY